MNKKIDMVLRNVNWIWFSILFIIEVLVGFYFFAKNPMFMFLFSDESRYANSFLNILAGFSWAISPLFILFFNIFEIYVTKSNSARRMMCTFIMLSVAYFIAYILFVVYCPCKFISLC